MNESRFPLLLGLLALVGCGPGETEKIDAARAQVERIAEDLDQRTTETGAYVRIDPDKLGERDPWGSRVEVVYAQGGVAETIVVRSAGPDRSFHTDDDIESTAFSTNLKGVGEGIRKNAEEVAGSAAKGAVKGAIEGFKESLPFGKKKPDVQEDDDPPAQ